jgi:hypothetical protein
MTCSDLRFYDGFSEPSVPALAGLERMGMELAVASRGTDNSSMFPNLVRKLRVIITVYAVMVPLRAFLYRSKKSSRVTPPQRAWPLSLLN